MKSFVLVLKINKNLDLVIANVIKMLLLLLLSLLSSIVLRPGPTCLKLLELLTHWTKYLRKLHIFFSLIILQFPYIFCPRLSENVFRLSAVVMTGG